MLLLCNDPQVLGPRVNPTWLNLLAGVIVSILLVLSGTLMASTLFPHIDVATVFVALSHALAVAGVLTVVVLRILARRHPRIETRASWGPAGKLTWRMPLLALLNPVTWSPALRVGILSLRA